MSSIVISAPRGLASSLPAGRKACYGVSVRGPGIESRSGNSCSPPTGVISGFVAAGEPMALEIPKGEARVFELILFLMPYGDNGACPTFSPAFANSQLSSFYLVGSVSVDIVLDATDIKITTSFPGLAANIAYQTNMSSTCKAYARPEMPPSPYSISGGGEKTLTGTGYTMRAQVGISHQQTVLTGTGYTMIIR